MKYGKDIIIDGTITAKPAIDGNHTVIKSQLDSIVVAEGTSPTPYFKNDFNGTEVSYTPGITITDSHQVYKNSLFQVRGVDYTYDGTTITFTTAPLTTDNVSFFSNVAKGSPGEDGAPGQAGADGVVDGITLDVQTKKALENLKGYYTSNYFDKTAIQDGYIINNSSQVITPPTANEKVSGKTYLSAGDYAFYEISADIYMYVQLFQLNGTYIRTEQIFSNNITKSFNMPVDGYIIFDVNNKVNTSIDDLLLSDYNANFNIASNNTEYGTYTSYNPYLKNLPKVELIQTDNLIDVDKILPYTGTESSYAESYIRFEVTGGEIVSIYDEFELYSATRKLIVEFDATDTEVGSFIPDDIGTVYKQHTLNASTTYIYLLLWVKDNSATWGGSRLTPSKLKNGIRLNLGEYFTKELTPYKVYSIDGHVVEYATNPFKGKKIAALGDSTMDEKHPSNNPGSMMDYFREDYEAAVRNYALGGAGLTDWSDTTVVTDGEFSSGLSHDNVVSNQIEEMIAQGYIPDVVVLSGGTNDAFRNRTIGDIDLTIAAYNTDISNLNKEEVYGILFWSYLRIKTYSPSTKIFFALPFKGNEYQNANDGSVGHNARLQPILDAYHVVADLLGVDIIDLNTNLLNNIDSNVPSVDFNDPLHPTTEGEKKAFKRMQPILLNYFNTNI